MAGNQTELIMYESDDGKVHIETIMQDETVWLSVQQMTELFQRDKSTISRHIKNIFDEGELTKRATVANFATVQKEGDREVTRNIDYYNLDVIISVGYRVKSLRGTQFRIWATNILKEYIRKGFALNDEKLKGTGGGQYWHELLDRIRDIRSSEKVLYRQVLDLYATSVDYDPHSEESIKFFKLVQNKLHYAAHGHTAAELIFERANANSPFMGLTTFSGAMPTMKDIKIAKNYLTEDELKVLNNLVSGYFDFAEIQAIRHKPMHMKEYIQQLDTILTSTGEKVLASSGTVSHQAAMDKAIKEYRKYQVKTLSPVEKDYLEAIKKLNDTAKTKRK